MTKEVYIQVQCFEGFEDNEGKTYDIVVPVPAEWDTDTVEQEVSEAADEQFLEFVDEITMDRAEQSLIDTDSPDYERLWELVYDQCGYQYKVVKTKTV